MPQCNNVCWFPSSGAWAFNTNGPIDTFAATADTATDAADALEYLAVSDIEAAMNRYNR